MLIKLVGNKKIFKMNLPETVEGNYWISDDSGDEKQKLINIKSSNGKWIACSNKYSKIINEQLVKRESDSISIIPSEKTIISEVGLGYYKKILISLQDTDEIYALYCFPAYDKKLRAYKIANEEISIGSSSKNDIILGDNIVNSMHARIFFKKGRWYIENYDTVLGTFLNDRFVDEEKVEKIENGDIISIADTKFMLLKDKLCIMGNLGDITVNVNSLKIDELQHKNEEEVKVVEENDDIIELYKESDYFYIAPRIIEKEANEEIKIDKPPQKNNEDSSTQMISLLSSIGMSAISIMTLITTLTNYNSSKEQFILKIITSAVMVLIMIGIPILRIILRKKVLKKKEKKKAFEYKKYINSKIIDINEIIENKKEVLRKNNMGAEECERIILEKSNELWERKIDDEDFLNITVGTGDSEINIGLDKEVPGFEIEKDPLLDIYYNVVNSSRNITEIPIIISLTDKRVVSIISKDKNKIKEYMQNIILQIAALQNYRNLKMVFFVNNVDDWDFIKMLPHIWDDASSLRFLASSRNEVNEISQYLEEQLNERYSKEGEESEKVNSKFDYRDFDNYYVIITDNYRKLHDIKIIDTIVNSNKNLGFSLISITNDIRQSPNKCKAFIELNGEDINFYENNDTETIREKMPYDSFERFDYSRVSKMIFNIPIKNTASKALALPEHYSFLEMFNVGNIDQLNVFERWTNNDSTKSLQAQIGIDATGNEIYLDAHEKYHGPHGLIAGTTGSGKSEFIITYILSLAINYHPDDVTFVLIDYKGGGLAGAFKKKNIQLPHLVGTITNIDSVGLQRSLESIQSELKRRQIMFNEAKNITNESTIDIYKYQRFYHDGILKEPISHLFIICDEFAELKQQQPDFMQELMSVSRIGRSLGVHLILATQKPAGIVNEQIRSNSKFGICLKVQSKSDSKDIIGKPDAATLKKAGQFYINVGNDEYFALGQSGYTGVQYVESDIVKKEQNDSVEIISNTGNVIKKVETKKKINENQKNSKGDQLTNVVNYLADLAKRKNIKENSLWLEPIPEKIYISELRKKYKVVAEKNEINPIIGEYDNPFNQLQDVLTLNLSKDGNTIIYGGADSGKEMILYAILYDTMIKHTSEEAQFYLIDYGTETLLMFQDAPSVGDIMTSEDTEKINRLFAMLLKEMKLRKQKLLKYNGDYELFLKTSGEKMPMIIVMINEYANFMQAFSKQEQVIIKILKDSSKYGIIFIITANTFSEARGRSVQNFRRKLALQLVSGDYSTIFNKARKKKPSSIYGRGLCTIDDDTVYEFQAARMFHAENITESIKVFIKKLQKRDKTYAPSIPIVPKFVSIDDVKDKMKDLSSVPVGVSTKNIETETYNFTKDVVTVITATDIEKTEQFIKTIIEEMKLLKNVDISIYDEEELILRSADSFVTRFNRMTKRINENYEKREERRILYIIIGIGKFLEGLGKEKERFTYNLNGARLSRNCNFIVIDDVNKIRGCFMDSWYKKYVIPGNGIFIGSGFDTQGAISTSLERKYIPTGYTDSFGYVTLKRKSTFVKLLGIKEEDEDNE